MRSRSNLIISSGRGYSYYGGVGPIMLYQNMLPSAYNGHFVEIAKLTSILTSMTLEIRSRSNLIISAERW